jgi:hypothetical protein
MTIEGQALLDFASNMSQIPPSIWARIAITEKLCRENWPQIMQQALGNKNNAA